VAVFVKIVHNLYLYLYLYFIPETFFLILCTERNETHAGFSEISVDLIMKTSFIH